MTTCYAIDWRGDWAFNCDFPGKDLRGERGPGDQCSNTCQRTSGCTHFVWTTYNGGTCWMKQGGASKSEAIYKGEPGAVCGIVGGCGANNGALGGGCKSGDDSRLEKTGRIVWSDEFNYSGAPSSSKWIQADDGLGGYNNEKQWYTNGGRNAQVKGGNLEIVSKRENYKGKSYTSAKLTSAKSFTYGTFEMRAKLPRGRGTWSAFWLLNRDSRNWPRSGEIDIMENVGFDEKAVAATIHCDKYNHKKGTQKSSTAHLDDPHYSFHTYSLDWTPTYIKGYVDGRNYFTYTKTENSVEAWPFKDPFNIILNNAVGGDWGGSQGIDDNSMPWTFVIDYVRVYDNGHTKLSY